jgi:plastocyanin
MKFLTKNFWTTLAATFLCLAVPLCGLGATTTVLVGSGGLVFTPVTANINVNDQVIWNWAGNFHSTTSGTVNGSTATPNGLWDSGVNNLPHSFTNLFNTAGTFPYYCSIHFASGMKGTIIVAAANVPPTITITNPVDGVVFSEPANVTIQASASDSDGTVTNVQFLVGPTVLTNETSAPFSVTTNNLAAGSYSFSTVATDNGGLTATNTVTISVVTPVPLALDAATQLSPASFQFNYSANVGLTYIVQQSTNLASPSWTPIFTNTATSNPVTFVDSNATANPGFYRVGRLPNP